MNISLIWRFGIAAWSRLTNALFRARLVNERTCTNCHSYQNYGTNAFFFHLRFHNGGTVFNVNGELAKRDLILMECFLMQLLGMAP